MKYDLVIIGGGPTGINCGIEAHKKGLKFIILEKGVLVNSLYHFPTNMTFFSTSIKLEIGDIPFISHGDKPTRKEALEYYRRLVSTYNLRIAYDEEVQSMSSMEDGTYLLNTSQNKQYQSTHVIVATGFYGIPNLLNIPGEKLSKVKHYYDEAHPYIGRNILVVGGANSACDVALETWQKGANVTMVIRQKELYQKVKYWILPNIENRIKEGSIKAYFESDLIKINPKSVDLRTPKGLINIENDYVLAMTGYTPDYNLLHALGIKIQKDQYLTPIHSEDTLESNLQNVYLAGVVNGGKYTSKYFIENTRHHAELIIQKILEVGR